MSNGPPSRDRRSLQDLAKLASSPNLSPAAKTPPPPSVSTPKSEHDSGIVDLKVAATDSAATERAKTTPLASQGIFEDDAENPSIAPPPMSVPPASAKIPAQPAAKPRISAQVALGPAPAAPGGTSSKSGVMIPVLIGLGLAALATVGFMVTRAGKDEAPKAPTVDTAPAAVEKKPGTAAPSAAAPTPAAATAAAPAPENAAADPAVLPAAGADPGKGASAGGRATRGPKKGGGTGEAPGAGGSLGAAMAQAAGSPPATPDSPPATPTTPGALNEAMQHAVGGSSTPAPITAPAGAAEPGYAPGTVPEKPSQGAVTSALNRALPAARNCLNADDPVSKANVTFSSPGTVSSVVVTGSAAGKPAEECIKSAMMKASVAPFAQATYSANVTVRPN